MLGKLSISLIVKHVARQKAFVKFTVFSFTLSPKEFRSDFESFPDYRKCEWSDANGLARQKLFKAYHKH